MSASQTLGEGAQRCFWTPGSPCPASEPASQHLSPKPFLGLFFLAASGNGLGTLAWEDTGLFPPRRDRLRRGGALIFLKARPYLCSGEVCPPTGAAA